MKKRAQNILKLVQDKNIPTPVFVYDHSVLLQQISTLKGLCQNITEHYSIAYSYKTNPLLTKYINQDGCAMQITSAPHFEAVKKLVGKDGLKKCFFNTASLTQDIARKLSASSIQIVVDSLVQIELMNNIAKDADRVVPIFIRIDAGIKVHNTPFGTSGTALGLSFEQAKRVILSLSKYRWIEFRGIHNHAASQNTDLSSWKANMRALEKFIMSLPQHIPLYMLNLGGGYPIQYINATPLSVRKIFSQAIKPSLKIILKRFPDLQLIIEPGRFLAGPAGFLIATVTNLQPPKGIVVDASLFAAFADRFLSKMTFQPTVYAKKNGHKKMFIRGSSPASIDYFGDYSNLPELRVGDALVFGMMGAYASSMGPNFSGVVRPKEYLLKENILTPLA